VILLTALGLAGCMTIRPPSGVQPVARRMVTTGYCKCGKCCGWERTWYGRAVHSSGSMRGKPKQVGMTASGAMARYGTIAADPRLYPFGTIMFIDGYGYGRVEDTGGGIKGEHIDLYFHSHREAREWGRQNKMVRIWSKPRGR